MCTSVPSGRSLHLFFVRGQRNAHNWRLTKFTEDANENKQGRCYYCRKGKNNISVHLDLTKRHYLLLKDFYNKVEDEGSIDFLCADINF